MHPYHLGMQFYIFRGSFISLKPLPEMYSELFQYYFVMQDPSGINSKCAAAYSLLKAPLPLILKQLQKIWFSRSFFYSHFFYYTKKM